MSLYLGGTGIYRHGKRASELALGKIVFWESGSRQLHKGKPWHCSTGWLVEREATRQSLSLSWPLDQTNSCCNTATERHLEEEEKKDNSDCSGCKACSPEPKQSALPRDEVLESRSKGEHEHTAEKPNHFISRWQWDIKPSFLSRWQPRLGGDASFQEHFWALCSGPLCLRPLCFGEHGARGAFVHGVCGLGGSQSTNKYCGVGWIHGKSSLPWSSSAATSLWKEQAKVSKE